MKIRPRPRWQASWARPSDRLVELDELGPQPRGTRLVEIVDYRQGPLPGVSGGIAVTGVTVRVPKVGQDRGLAMAVAEIPCQVEAAVIVGHGGGIVAEMVVGVADAVQGGGLATAVAR